jgi:hypothetical protein
MLITACGRSQSWPLATLDVLVLQVCWCSVCSSAAVWSLLGHVAELLLGQELQDKQVCAAQLAQGVAVCCKVLQCTPAVSLQVMSAVYACVLLQHQVSHAGLYWQVEL